MLSEGNRAKEVSWMQPARPRALNLVPWQRGRRGGIYMESTSSPSALILWHPAQG